MLKILWIIILNFWNRVLKIENRIFAEIDDNDNNDDDDDDYDDDNNDGNGVFFFIIFFFMNLVIEAAI